MSLLINVDIKKDGGYFLTGESKLEADDATHLVLITRACVDATASLTNGCVLEIHQLEEKRSDLRKVLLLKLAYSVEQLFTYASLVYTFEDPGESQQRNPIFYRVFHLSIQCMQAVLTDPDIQVTVFVNLFTLIILIQTIDKVTTCRFKQLPCKW